jgi:hypothetical protein
MNLTENFTLEEMIVSQTAARRGIDNTPSESVEENLRMLCITVLEPLRTIVRKPIIVTSGYRSPQLNAAVGGRPNSQHTTGNAADIIVPGIPTLEVCRTIARYLNYDQCINECGAWCHVSVVPYNNRKENLSVFLGNTRVGF